MTTPPLLPGRPSDKLVAPLNAPRGGTVTSGVQPGVSGQVVLAQFVIIFGSQGGIFIYDGSPGPGNPPLYSFGNVTSDPYGNPVDPGITAGQAGAIQILIQALGGSAQVFFVPAGSYNADASAGIIQTGTQAILELLGAQTTASPDPASDRVGLFLWDHGTGGAGATADIQAIFFPSDGSNGWFLFDGNDTGLNLPHVNNIQGVQPGTGTDPATPPVSEGWHQATPLLNSWAGSGGVGGLFYRLLPIGPTGLVEVIGDIVNTTATGNSVCFTMPVAYRPTTAQNHPASWNNPQASNAASAPWITYLVNGGIQVTGIEAANKEIFFHFLAPLGNL